MIDQLELFSASLDHQSTTDETSRRLFNKATADINELHQRLIQARSLQIAISEQLSVDPSDGFVHPHLQDPSLQQMIKFVQHRALTAPLASQDSAVPPAPPGSYAVWSTNRIAALKNNLRRETDLSNELRRNLDKHVAYMKLYKTHKQNQQHELNVQAKHLKERAGKNHEDYLACLQEKTVLAAQLDSIQDQKVKFYEAPFQISTPRTSYNLDPVSDEDPLIDLDPTHISHSMDSSAKRSTSTTNNNTTYFPMDTMASQHPKEELIDNVVDDSPSEILML